MLWTKAVEQNNTHILGPTHLSRKSYAFRTTQTEGKLRSQFYEFKPHIQPLAMDFPNIHEDYRNLFNPLTTNVNYSRRTAPLT